MHGQVIRLGVVPHDVHRLIRTFGRLVHIAVHLERSVKHLRGGKHASKRVVIFSRDRIEFVIMTASTTDGQPEKSARHRIDPILPLVRHDLRVFSPVVLRTQAAETERGQIRFRRGFNFVRR